MGASIVKQQTRAYLFALSAVLLWSTVASAFKLTLRDALLLALEAETRARDYYGEAMEHLTEPQVNELFGELRDSEIEHQRLLRAELEKL